MYKKNISRKITTRIIYHASYATCQNIRICRFGICNKYKSYIYFTKVPSSC
ncbi:hypothetical protein Hanom_Chr00s000012g01616591 [Helianthus anomalus]